MSIHKINNIFSEEELKSIYEIIYNTHIPILKDGSYIPAADNFGTGVDSTLGRLQIGNLQGLSKQIKDKLADIAHSLSDTALSMDHALYVEYSSKYGAPNLPPHFDYDTNDMIINFQLEANTSWDLGLGLETYSLENNSALIFNGNEHIHWRVHKKFNDGEYVRMIFFRFYNSEKRSDYSHLNYLQDDDVFKEVRDFRDSLNPYI